MTQVPSITLNDGVEIPQLGFGTFQIPSDEAVDATLAALEVGYRHLDTAQMYGNEAEVGRAVRESGIDRSEIFVTSKLNNGFHEPERAMRAFDESIERLGIDYLDLFLIHWPLPTIDVDYVDTWRAMEKMKATGKVRSIGVSNFEIEHLQRLFDETDTVPAVNQIEVHPYWPQTALRGFNRNHEIMTEAWSPIAQGDILDEQVLADIGERLDKTPAQVVLRWHIQRGDIVFPKSVHPDRMRENFDIFDVELEADDMMAIDALAKGDGRRGPDPATFDYVPD